MSHYCTKCQTNWSRLRTIDNGFDSYEYCPICHTDHFIEEGKEGPAVAMMINGKIVDSITGQPVRPVIDNPTPVKDAIPFDAEQYYHQQQEAQERQIKEYQSIFEQEGQAAAEQFFFNQKLELK